MLFVITALSSTSFVNTTLLYLLILFLQQTQNLRMCKAHRKATEGAPGVAACPIQPDPHVHMSMYSDFCEASSAAAPTFKVISIHRMLGEARFCV